jgi:hypothetical protein
VLSQRFDWLYLPHFLLLKWVVVKYNGVPFTIPNRRLFRILREKLIITTVTSNFVKHNPEQSHQRVVLKQTAREGHTSVALRSSAPPAKRGIGPGCVPAQACPCSQMAVQLLSSVNRPCCQRDRMRDQMPQMPRMNRTIQVCLVLLCPGWSTTLCADGSWWTMLFESLPWTATAGLLSAAAGTPTILASRTACNAVTATAFTVRGNAGYSFTSTRSTLPHSKGEK